MAKSIQKVQPQETAIVSYDEELAAAASAEAAAVPPSGGNFVSLLAGIISIGGQPVKDNKLHAIITDYCFENQFYTEKYDPNNPTSPVCFAFSRDEKTMVPHPDASAPQSEACENCPQNRWGSDVDDAGRPKKGKACKNIMRLQVIPLTEDPAEVEKDEPMYMKLSVMNVKGFRYYLNVLASAMFRRPVWSMGTEVTTVPDVKSQFKVIFNPTGALSPEVVAAVKAKKELQGDALMFPYQPPQEAPVEEPAPAPAPSPAPRGRKF